MKIREVRVQNLRNFGADASTVSFVDAVTGQVRPLTVLVGSNGSGKTTVLEVIEEACLEASHEKGAVDRKVLSEFGPHARPVLFATIEGQFSRTVGATGPAGQEIVIFKMGHGGVISTQLPNLPVERLHLDFFDILAQAKPVLIYFTAYRYLAVPRQSSTISRPAEAAPNVYRYQSSDQYEGSLEQLWVWQNYLDLEAQQEGHPNLLPFVETIQTILGREQRLTISKGEVWIERPHLGDRVRIHELPSGEKQVLLIFGEIVRRLRPQAIVMIDELEMSLHPALQRVVLHHLRRLAQQHDLQVIVTTHSMEIVAAADIAEVVNLDDMAFVEQTARSTAGAR